MKLLVPIVIVVSGCGGAELKRTCRDLCTELVSSCDVPAFPNVDSCIQGCTYNAEELGADVYSEFTCVQGAACDLFAIIECEHQYGVD